MKRSSLFIVFIVGIGLCQSFAQGYYFRHYQVENGLSHNTVFCAAQDGFGFMWFGTKDGLNRFDGNNFKVFRNNPADSNSLKNNFVYSLYLDKEENLWVGTGEGLYRYNREEENFRRVSGSSHGDVYDIREDAAGILWFLMGGRLYFYDKKLDSVQLFRITATSWITALHITNGTQIWYGTPGTLNRLNKATNETQSYQVFNQNSPSPARWIRRITDGPAGSLLIGTTDEGLKKFDTTTFRYTNILSQNADKTNIYVRDIIQADTTTYWIGTESGIFIYDFSTNRYTNLEKSFTNPYSLSDNAIYTLLKDKEGGIWAGSYFGGANYYRKQYTTFEKYFPDNSKHSISGNAVREICEDESGHLWIGTEDRGLNKLDKKTGLFTHFLPGTGPQSISYYNIHGLLYTDHHLWIGTFEHGIDIMDTRTGKVIKHFDMNTPGIRNNFFLSFCKTRSGQILAGNTTNLLLYHPAADSFSVVTEVPSNHFIYNVMEDREGFIWVATIGQGLYYYHPVTKQKGSFQHNPSDSNSIGSNWINNSFEDSKGYIWVGSEGGGLFRYDKKKQHFKTYTTTNGLPSNFVFKILEDDQHNLWISTSRGLAYMNTATETFTYYTVSNGILSDQFNYNSGYKDSDGRLYFGSVKGMISFNPHTFTPNTYQPPIYITGLQTNNQEFVPLNKKGQPHSIIQTKRVQLPYNKSSISIDFAALSYTAPEMIQYAYIMHGLQDGWTTVTTNRKAYFTDLSPGSYLFEVKVAGNNAAPSALLSIQILPPWWASPWAYLVYVIIAVAFAYWAISFFYNRAKERNRRRMEQLAHVKEKELYEAKIDFFTHVAHEIKTPLTLIKAPLEKLEAQVGQYPALEKNLHTMKKNTGRLIHLTNQLLDFRLAESSGYSLDFVRLNITHLLDETFADFKPLADEKKLQYQLNTPADPLYMMANEDALEKIFNNLFSNAIKYAVHVVQVNLEQVNNVIILRIYNDGFIIPQDLSEKIFEPFYRIKATDKQKGTGIGLALGRSLTLLHGGTLQLENNIDAKGNIFVLRLPLQPKAGETTKK